MISSPPFGDVQVVAAREVLRSTVEDLIHETRRREAAGKAGGAGTDVDGASIRSNGASHGAAGAASGDLAKVLIRRVVL